jgi:hypothetical protein
MVSGPEGEATIPMSSSSKLGFIKDARRDCRYLSLSGLLLPAAPTSPDLDLSLLLPNFPARFMEALLSNSLQLVLPLHD